jgi:N-acetylglucosamine-6-phosphate deacetylase
MTPALVVRGGAVLAADGWRDDCEVHASGGAITDLRATAPAIGEALDARDALVVPGFIDLHVHGAGGAMFEDADRDGVRRIRTTLAAHGTTALLATIAALPPEPQQRAVATIAAAMAEPGGARILGIHLEGPFLNPRRGGAQRTDWMRDPSIGELDRLQSAAGGAIRLLTIAPELSDALPLIRHARRRGIRVSLGHSEASAAQVEAAIAAGATHVTHCFNAMAPLHHREVGLAGMALVDDRLRIELIADGVHVDRRALALAVRSKPRGGWLLVSDGVAAVGQPPGALQLFGAACIASDAVRQADSGRLAGSCLTLAAAVRNIRQWLPDVSDEAILDAASADPAAAVGCDDRFGRIAVGRPADLVVLDRDWRLRAVVLAGEGCPLS